MRSVWALVLTLLLGAVASAEEVIVVSFSELQSCAYCIQLERVWKTQAVQAEMSQLGRKRQYVDVKKTPQAVLNKWGVTTWPATFLVLANDEGRVTSVLQRHDGVMSQRDLIRFMHDPRK